MFQRIYFILTCLAFSGCASTIRRPRTVQSTSREVSGLVFYDADWRRISIGERRYAVSSYEVIVGESVDQNIRRYHTHGDLLVPRLEIDLMGWIYSTYPILHYGDIGEQRVDCAWSRPAPGVVTCTVEITESGAYPMDVHISPDWDPIDHRPLHIDGVRVRMGVIPVGAVLAQGSRPGIVRFLLEIPIFVWEGYNPPYQIHLIPEQGTFLPAP